MAKVITVQDCEDLYNRFMKYTETAEQHEFPLLFEIHYMLTRTMTKIRLTGEVGDQSEARAMFRVVLRAIGGDYSEYKEEENK